MTTTTNIPFAFRTSPDQTEFIRFIWLSGTGAAGVIAALLYSSLTQIGLKSEMFLFIMLASVQNDGSSDVGGLSYEMCLACLLACRLTRIILSDSTYATLLHTT